MAFTPPLFKNFGKSLKDLVEKKFDFNREVKVKTSTSAGVVFESTGRSTSKGNDFSGLVKTTYKRPDFGTFELELDTDGKAKYSAENDQLKKGVVVKISGDQDPTGTLDASYRQEHFALSGVAQVSRNVTTAEVTGVIGVDGLSVGGQCKYDVNAQAVSDYNTGSEYSQPDFTVTVKTADSADKLAISYIHNISPDVAVGGQFEYRVSSVSALSSLLTAVGSYNVDRDTVVKGKFNSQGIVTGALEQRLFNPKLKYGLTTEFNARHHSALPERVGVSVTFGEN